MFFGIFRPHRNALSLKTLCVLLTFCILPTAADPVDFSHQIVPLLSENCTKCHTNGEYKGSFSLDTRETMLEFAVVAGDVESSELISRVGSDDPEYRMPPKGPGLSDDQVQLLKRWVEEGAAWEPGFTFQKEKYAAPLKPRRPVLPADATEENPLDAFVYAYWKEHDVTPPPPLDDAAFMRRVTLDLTGILPDYDAIEEFVRNPEPDKREKLVDRLLAGRVAYADHWFTFWCDLLRNDFTGPGYISGGRQQITDWLYLALVENMPCDEFVRDLVSANPGAEGFVKGIVWRGQVNASQYPELQFAQNVGQVFLGINLKCASCHDSFIDNWKLKDTYGLAAASSDVPLEIHRCDKPTGEFAEASFLFPELGTVDPQAPRQARLQQVAKLLTHPNNGRLTRTIVNRLWHRLLGRGIVEPVDVMDSPPWSADVLDYLAVHLADHNYDLKATLALIANSRAYQSQVQEPDAIASADDYVFRGPVAKRMTAEEFVDSLWRITGTAPTETVKDDLFVKATGEKLTGPDGTPADSRSPVRFQVRSGLVLPSLLMRSLGRPNREQVVTTRPSELTTLEALELSNGQPLTDLLAAGAERLLKLHADADAQTLCTIAFEDALSRQPSADELDCLRDMAGQPVTQQGLEDVLWCVFMLPEFQLIH